MDRPTDRQTDGQTDGQTDRPTTQGPRINFEIGGAPLVTQYWGGTRHFFLLTLYSLKNIGGARAPRLRSPCDRQTDGQTDRRMTDRQTDRHRDRRTDGRMDMKCVVNNRDMC